MWSHVNLGKIFDLTGQRERAVNEYRQALQTNDNTQGAVNEARARMQKAVQSGYSGTRLTRVLSTYLCALNCLSSVILRSSTVCF